MKLKRTLAIMVIATMVLTGCVGREKPETVEETAESTSEVSRYVIPDGVEEPTVDDNETIDLEDIDTPELMNITDTGIILPDGREVPYIKTLEGNGIRIYQSCDVKDRTNYSEEGLIDKLHNLDLRFSIDGKEYYFKGELLVDSENKKISVTNIDTNLEKDDSYTGINIYNTDGYMSIAIDSSSIQLGKLDMVDYETITLNGVDISYKGYFRGFRETMTSEPITNVRLFDNKYQANVGDIWVDKDDTNFGFIIDYMEAVNYKDWRAIDPGSIEIGYSIKLAGY